jgi:hypothetical protein
MQIRRRRKYTNENKLKILKKKFGGAFDIEGDIGNESSNDIKASFKVLIIPTEICMKSFQG